MPSPLFNLYSWMIGAENASVNSVIKEPFAKNSFTKESMENEINATKEQLTSLIREARIKNLPGFAQPSKNTNSASSALTSPGECQKFLDFLQDLHKAAESTPFSLAELYDFAFAYLAKSDSPTKKTKGQTLFMSFLDSDANGARRWYTNHQEFSQANFPGIPFLVSTRQEKPIPLDEEKPTSLNAAARVTERKEKIQSLLQFERNIAGILPQFREAAHDVVEFTALLLEAIEKGVSSEQILDRGVLNDFILYHRHYSGTHDEIQHLFNLLEQFKASDLVKKAKSTFMRGEQYILPAFTPRKENTISFTATKQNLDNLVQVFGESVLIPACMQLAKTNEPKLEQWLTTYVNQLSPESLAASIKKAEENDHTAVLQVLGKLISTDTVNKLLAAGQGAIFYLAPYNPDILATLSDTNSLKNHLEALRNSGHSTQDIVVQIAVLIQNMPNEGAVELLFDNLLDLIIENPSLADDEELLGLLGEFAKYEQILIAKKMVALASDWHNQFHKLIEEKNYPAIEDLWKKKISAFSLLQDLSTKKHETDFPSDKYALYAHIVKKQANQTDFQLQDFLNQVLPYEEQTEGISTRERALLEILIAVDNETIRQSAVALLKNIPDKDGFWIREVVSEEDSILSRAISNGNVGFIRFLFTPNTKNITPINSKLDAISAEKALIQAVSTGELEIVKLICLGAADKLNAAGMQKALVNALNKTVNNPKQWEIVQFLCTLPDNKPDAETISRVYTEALINKQWGVLQSLCRLMDAKTIKGLLHGALDAEQWEVAQYICGLTTDNKPDSLAITSTLEVAVIQGKLEFVKFICNLTTDNKPNIEAIALALMIATTSGQLEIVKFLFTLTNDSPFHAEIIKGTLHESLSRKQWEVAQYICTLNPSAAGEFLIDAASNGNLKAVKFFCSLSKENGRPDEKTLRLALEKSRDAYASADPIKNEARKNEIKTILQEAIKSEKLSSNTLKEAPKIEALRHCVTELNKYGRYAITQAKQFNNLIDRFVTARKQNATSKDLRPIKEEFKRTLQENYRKMGSHSKIWQSLLDNISKTAADAGIGSSADKFLKNRNGFFSPQTFPGSVQQGEKKTPSDMRPRKH